MRKIWNCFLLICPVTVTWALWREPVKILIVLSILLHYAVISINSICKGRQSMWLFGLLAVSLIPVNIELGRLYCGAFGYSMETPVAFVVNFILGFSAMLSAEEIFLGILGRFLWKKQKSIRIVSKD
ncbi:MAG: hypothetical protein J6N53_17965 [Lachnospiraceae bacterium]|nr:hypothetical protein [Lachnospiraceae bacterium]